MAGDRWVALRLAYLGWNYHGVVRQPGLSTIEGLLSTALAEQGIETRLRFTSRTDRGVSAVDNVATYRGKIPNLSWLNASLPKDVSVWGIAESNSRPRALRKTYAYVIPFRLDPVELAARLDEASISPNLCREGKAPRPEHEVLLRGSFTHVLVSGSSFCWEMVRRLVGMALGMILNRKMVVAPPEGLLLLRTELSIPWAEVQTENMEPLLKELEGGMWKWGLGLTMRGVISELISSGQPRS